MNSNFKGNYQFPFEKLEIWQLAVEFTVHIYKLSKKFPKEELYSITSQLRRSSNSVNSNIAEGASRKSSNDKARYFEMAYSSLMETLNHCITCYRLDYITIEEIEIIRLKVSELSNKINSYYNRIKSS